MNAAQGSGSYAVEPRTSCRPGSMGQHSMRGWTNNTMQNLKRRQFYMQNQAVKQLPNNYLCASASVDANARTDDPNTGQI
ncbi:MAG: hypothetical protein K2Y28_00375 [Burkholderiaceae bacterium]|nr:hypothetical protein [Burkholderiaceae bacterium]